VDDALPPPVLSELSPSALSTRALCLTKWPWWRSYGCVRPTATMDGAVGTVPAEQARVAEELRDALASDAAPAFGTSPSPESPPLPPSPPPADSRAVDAEESPTASPAVPTGSLETASPAWDQPVLYELLHRGSRLLTMPLAQLAADPQVRYAAASGATNWH